MLFIEYQKLTYNIMTLGWNDKLLVQNLNSILEMQIHKKTALSRNMYLRNNAYSCILNWTTQIVYKFFFIVLDFGPSICQQGSSLHHLGRQIQQQLNHNIEIFLMTAYLNIKIKELYNVISYLNADENKEVNSKYQYLQLPCVEELKTILDSEVGKSMSVKS